jgi:hypothetical protein
VLLTDIPAVGRGVARVGGGGGAASRVPRLFAGPVHGDNNGAAAAAGGLAEAGGGGCEVQEECSKEQLEELMRQLRGSCPTGSGATAAGRAQAGTAAAVAAAGVEPDGVAAELDRRRAAVVTLALHAERDAELRAALVAAGLLEEVAAMLEVGGGCCLTPRALPVGEEGAAAISCLLAALAGC